MPNGRVTTYICIICADRPEKPNPKHVCHTIGGNRIDYSGNTTSTKTADITRVKTLLNSVMTVDLKDFFLGTPLDRYEYIRIPSKIIPQPISDLYDLESITVNGFAYAEVRRGM